VAKVDKLRETNDTPNPKMGRKSNCLFCNARKDVFRQDRHDLRDQQDFFEHVRLYPVNPYNPVVLCPM
jgi:hypothetical protein